MKKIFFSVLLLISAKLLLAQSGKITGKVINAGSGQGLSNATVTLIEKSDMRFADQDGNFSFGKLAAGIYSIRCTYAGYIEKVVDSIIVKDRDITSITISLVEKSTLANVVVQSTRSRAAGETVASLLIARKNFPNSADFVTYEQVRKTPDKTMGDVIKRVSGASIQDDRFAIIRGLNDRYNASFINGAPLPSTESDRKAFAFDIFPSSILDNLIIYKTATPDKTGEFAGGIIDITTKSILPKSFTSISFGVAYNTLVTGKNRYYSENMGSKDWIGIDDGTRSLPAEIPSSADIKNVLTPAQKAGLTKYFKDYRWGVQSGITKPAYRFELSKGFNIERNQQEFLGVLLSVNYIRTYMLNEGPRDNFDTYDFSVPYHTPAQKGNFTDSIFNDEVVVSALANISVKINNRNSISWKNNLSINSDNKLIRRTGAYDYSSDPDAYTRETVRWFTSNKIIASQLIGEHTIGPAKTKVNWLAGYSTVDREIPNLSRTAYTGRQPDISNLVATFSTPPAQTTGTGTMFFSSSNESIKNLKADVTQPYTFLKNSQNFLKIGGGYQLRERDFWSRTLGLSPYDMGGVSFDYSLLSLPEDQILLPEHFGVMKNGKGGFLIQDGTLPNSNYVASSSTVHAYIMSDQRFSQKLRVVYGVRMERFHQKLDALVDLNQPINLNTIVTDYLPSVNVVYAITPKTNLRASYATTINRPEFRELAPFLFYEYVSNYSITGQSSLVRAKIRNYDVRYEFFPGRAQLFSVSVFYKQFTNPIEFITVPNTSSQAVYMNSKSAEVYGVEAEFRTLLSTLFGIKNERSFLNKFTLSANGSYMRSHVKLVPIAGVPIEQLITDRALQGQSPYIINTGLTFNDEKTGIASTLSVNRVGDRVAIAGAYNVPDMYEKARTVMDFQVTKFFMNNAIELKFNAKDILAQPINFYYDFKKSKSYSDQDRYYTFNEAPRIFSLSATLKF